VSLASGGSRTVYFKLSSAGRKLLGAGPGRRLAVEATSKSASGPSASAPVTLVPFTTQGPAPARSLTQSSDVEIVAATAFTYRDTVGGILAGCLAPAPCALTATLTHGGVTIAQTGTEQLGVDELGYVVFHLTPHGRTLLEHSSGNQLGASVTLTNGVTSASGQIVLVGFR